MTKGIKVPSRAVTNSNTTCGLSTRSAAGSLCSIDLAKKNGGSGGKAAAVLNKRLALLSSRLSSRSAIPPAEKVNLIDRRLNKKTTFPVFKEAAVFSYKAGVKKRKVRLTRDFDCESDDELINVEVKRLESSVLKSISKTAI